ncbi:MAG: hypothetical protein NT166_02865, partial [Candidatus Aminicenantes bacterium]|nr:hypothetical protein [Candidatus Aminicenantes bacterium]
GPWLKKYPLEMETHFVIKSWLDAKGEKEVIKEYVGPWLKKYPLEMETSFVIPSWLDAGGEKEVIKDYVGPWLKKYPLEMETGFVIKSWLKAGGNFAVLEKYIKPWLARFPLDEENTSFIINAWLHAGGNPAEVAPFVIPWLEKFSNSFEASYVIKAWFKSTKDVESIKTYAHRWLLQFKDHTQADFVIKRFCRSKDIPADILDAAVHWCRKYASEGEALFALSYLTQRHMESKILAAPWLTDVLQQWIGKKRLKEHDIDNIEAIMYSITQNRDFHRSGDNVQLRIQWFLSPHSFPSRTPTSPDYFLQKRFYFQVYCQLLLDGLIEIPGHEAEVEKFLHWVNRWHPGNKRQIRPDLETLAAQFPQHASLWKTVEY